MHVALHVPYLVIHAIQRGQIVRPLFPGAAIDQIIPEYGAFIHQQCFEICAVYVGRVTVPNAMLLDFPQPAGNPPADGRCVPFLDRGVFAHAPASLVQVRGREV